MLHPVHLQPNIGSKYLHFGKISPKMEDAYGNLINIEYNNLKLREAFKKGEIESLVEFVREHEEEQYLRERAIKEEQPVPKLTLREEFYNRLFPQFKEDINQYLMAVTGRDLETWLKLMDAYSRNDFVSKFCQIDKISEKILKNIPLGYQFATPEQKEIEEKLDDMNLASEQYEDAEIIALLEKRFYAPLVKKVLQTIEEKLSG